MSQIATSIEQSKRIMEARVPKDSADMRWEQFAGCIPLLCYQQGPTPLIATKITPAWSLSALWQMVHELDKTYEFPSSLSTDELIETLTSIICYRREHQ